MHPRMPGVWLKSEHRLVDATTVSTTTETICLPD